MESLYINLGQLIKDKRLEKNLSTKELADILGISVWFLNNLENAKTDTFNTELILKLHNTLGISLFNFLPIPDNNLYSSNLLLKNLTNEIPDDILGVLSSDINEVIKAYVSSIKKHNYDSVFIDKLKNKLLNELAFIDDFKLK